MVVNFSCSDGFTVLFDSPTISISEQLEFYINDRCDYFMALGEVKRSQLLCGASQIVDGPEEGIDQKFYVEAKSPRRCVTKYKDVIRVTEISIESIELSEQKWKMV